MRKLSKTKKAQTLVETLVAVGVILTVLVAAYGLVIQGLKVSRLSLEKTQAFNLAQEGIEKIRNKRDSNYKQGVEWLQDIKNNSESNLLGKYRRNITISNCEDEDDKNNCREVTVTVNWNFYGQNQSMFLKERLYNWK